MDSWAQDSAGRTGVSAGSESVVQVGSGDFGRAAAGASGGAACAPCESARVLRSSTTILRDLTGISRGPEIDLSRLRAALLGAWDDSARGETEGPAFAVFLRAPFATFLLVSAAAVVVPSGSCAPVEFALGRSPCWALSFALGHLGRCLLLASGRLNPSPQYSQTYASSLRLPACERWLAPPGRLGIDEGTDCIAT